MPIFWQAITCLERINLKVIAATADGASQNRNTFRIHKYLCGDSDADLIYHTHTHTDRQTHTHTHTHTQNIHAKEMLFVYFFADAPHLVKTVRNCLYHSGSGRGARYMSNNGFFLFWSHIACLYYKDLESSLKLVNKLTSDHINLTSYSVMRVSPSTQ